jgi:hypothetical protein
MFGRLGEKSGAVRHLRLCLLGAGVVGLYNKPIKKL